MLLSICVLPTIVYGYDDFMPEIRTVKKFRRATRLSPLNRDVVKLMNQGVVVLIIFLSNQ